MILPAYQKAFQISTAMRPTSLSARRFSELRSLWIIECERVETATALFLRRARFRKFRSFLGMLATSTLQVAYRCINRAKA